MTDTAKRRAIIFLTLTALITVLLAVALPQLKLQAGVPLPWIENRAETGQQPGEASPGLSIRASTFLQTVLGLFFLILLIYLVVRRPKRRDWATIGRALLRIAGLSLSLTLALYFFSNTKVTIAPSAAEIIPPEAPVVAVGPPLAPVPVSMIWLSWIGLAGLLLLLAFVAVRVRFRRPVERDPLALEAEQAVEAIEAGQDLQNVIIRCYEQMSVVLKKERGLALEETMTAREFEQLLEKRGFPSPPVRDLTRLFEIARYAAQAPGPAEEKQAVECLNAIARSSPKRRRGPPL